MVKRVGVVIPSYNQGQYLEKALLSAIANRRNVEMDIAVIDGGSEDNSVSIIKKYEKELKFWCSEPDKGQADAINKGIQKLSDCDLSCRIFLLCQFREEVLFESTKRIIQSDGL